MVTITVAEYLKRHTKAEAARAFGVTPGAIQRILRDGREGYVTVDENGAFVEYYEIKRGFRRSA